MKRKYVLKKEPAHQSEPTREQQKTIPLTADLIRKFLAECNASTLPKVTVPHRRIITSGSLERAVSTRQTKPEWRPDDGPEMLLKRQLTESSSNGGWTAGVREQSIQRNLTLLNDLKFALNILAEDNFESMLERICSLLENSVPEGSELLMEVVLSKAEFETKYHGLYARLCLELTEGNGLLARGELCRRLLERLKQINPEVFNDSKQRKNLMNSLLFFGQLFLQGVADRGELDELTRAHLEAYFADGEHRLRSLQVLVVLYDHVGRYEKNHPEQATRNTKVHCRNNVVGSQRIISFADMFQLFKELATNVGDTRLWSLIQNTLERRSKHWPKGEDAKPHQPESPNQPTQQLHYVEVPQPEEREHNHRDSFTKLIEKVDISGLEKSVTLDDMLFSEVFVLHFFRHKMPQIERLVALMTGLIERSIVNLEDLIQSFQLKFEQLVLEEADFPLCKQALCKLFRPYVESGQFGFEQLRQYIASDEEEQFVSDLEAMMTGMLEADRQS